MLLTDFFLLDRREMTLFTQVPQLPKTLSPAQLGGKPTRWQVLLLLQPLGDQQ